MTGDIPTLRKSCIEMAAKGNKAKFTFFNATNIVD